MGERKMPKSESSPTKIIVPSEYTDLVNGPKTRSRMPIAMTDQPTASPPVLGILEAAKALSVLVDILEASPSAVVLGEKSEDSDPICEGLRRLLAQEAPLLIQREIIPGDPRTVEVFDIRRMIFDKGYASACLDFRKNSSIPESGMNYNEIISRLGEWKTPINVSGAYALDGGK